jgi:hypothetical protein
LKEQVFYRRFPRKNRTIYTDSTYIEKQFSLQGRLKATGHIKLDADGRPYKIGKWIEFDSTLNTYNVGNYIDTLFYIVTRTIKKMIRHI